MRSGNFKGKLILLTMLVFLFAIFVAGKVFIFDKQNELGEIKVVSSPIANVFIDQVNVGKTPLSQKLKVGEYLVKLIPDREATATASWQGRLKIYKNAVSYINREMGNTDISSAGEISTVTKMETKPKNSDEGEIYVETDPNGALVYLDNDEKGVASLILTDVMKGSHELSIYLPRFFRRTMKINIEPQFRTNVFVKLAIDQQAQKEATRSAAKKDNIATQSASANSSAKKIFIKIKDTPTGWLRVREEPSVNASESARINPGEQFRLLEEQDNWYKIAYEEGKEGWVASQYSEKIEE